jgi:hypothetical protein
VKEFACVCADVNEHPVASSAAILIVLGVMLSPYVLVAVAALVLYSGVQLLPQWAKPGLPAPLVQVSVYAARAALGFLTALPGQGRGF